MAEKPPGIERDRRRVLRGTGTAGIAAVTGAIGLGGITGASASEHGFTATTAFDSGGGVEIDREDARVELTKVDEAGYTFLGYMHFGLEDASGTPVTVEITNLDESRMSADHRLLYTTDPVSGDWTRLEDDVGGGFTHTFDADEVYLSGYRAYPYQRTVDRVEEVAAYSTYVDTEVIGQSAGGRDIHAIQVTDPDVPEDEKQDVVSIARQHPGEVEGSWHMDAALEYVIDTFCEPEHEFEGDYRFHFVPNANPDGIYEGLHRNTPDGVDLNRQWDTESPVEIETIKSYLRDTVDDVHWGFDFHSSTNAGHEAVIYDERAVDSDDLETVRDIASHSLSYPDRIRSTDSNSLAHGFLYDEFDAVMVVTEAWTYREYTAPELATEGRRFFREAVPRAE